MAKKKSAAKFLVGVTAIAVAAKVVYDKYKVIKNKYEKEENESVDQEVKKYNAVAENKMVEIEDEVFSGCEIKAIASKLTLDLSLAEFQKDEYINFKSNASSVKIILPEGVNVTCDIENVASGIKNLVDNVEEDDINTVFIIGKATASQIEIIPADFYLDEDDDFEDDDFDDEIKENDKSAEDNLAEDKPQNDKADA